MNELMTKLASISIVCILALLVTIKDSQSASVVTSRRPKGDHHHGQNCTNHLQIIDRCSSLATYSYATSINQYPLNANEMKSSCERIADGLKCLKTYSKCVSSVARRSVNAFATARSKHSRRLCTNLGEPRTLEFVRSAECIVKSNKRSRMVANEKELISTIQFLAINTTIKWDARFHGACCAASAYKLQVLKDIEPECGKYKEAQEDMVNSMVGELLESACPEANRLTEICAKLPKVVLTKEWKSGSLTGAALDLIVGLSDSAKSDQQ